MTEDEVYSLSGMAISVEIAKALGYRVHEYHETLRGEPLYNLIWDTGKDSAEASPLPDYTSDQHVVTVLKEAVKRDYQPSMAFVEGGWSVEMYPTPPVPTIIGYTVTRGKDEFGIVVCRCFLLAHYAEKGVPHATD